MSDLITTLEHLAAAIGYQFAGQTRAFLSALAWTTLGLTGIWLVAFGIVALADAAFSISLVIPAFLTALVSWPTLVVMAVQRYGLWGCAPWSVVALVSLPVAALLSAIAWTLIGLRPVST